RGPVRDAGADRNGGEAIGRGREEGRDVAPLAPPHAPDFGRIDPTQLDQVLDTGKNVPGIADAEIVNVELAEFFAVPRAAAIVDAQYQSAAAGPDVSRVVACGSERGPVDSSRPAMNNAQKRMFLRRVKVGRLAQHSVNRRAVLTFPGNDFRFA